jgi:hypothetical protein
MVFLALIFTKLTHAQQHCMQTFHTEFHTNLSIAVESTDRNSLTSTYEVWLSLCWFSQNWKKTNKQLWTSVLNIIQTWQKMYKIWEIFHLCPQVQYSFHSTNSHETHTGSKTLCGHPLYQISPSSVKEYGKNK